MSDPSGTFKSPHSGLCTNHVWRGLAWSGHSEPLIFTYFYDVYWFMAALALHYRAQAFSSCGDWGLLSATLVQASHCSGFSCWAQARGSVGFSSWDIPGPGMQPMSPALAGRFLTTGPPRKFFFFGQTTWLLGSQLDQGSSLTVKVSSPNYWTTREFPHSLFVFILRRYLFEILSHQKKKKRFLLVVYGIPGWQGVLSCFLSTLKMPFHCLLASIVAI